MFPAPIQRVLIVLGVIVGGAALLLIAAPLRPMDGSSGLTLLSARVGVAGACGLLALAALPAVVFALITSARGNPVAGPFIMGLALAFLASAGGSSIGWLWRAALPGDYRLLIIETLVWFTALLLLIVAMQTARVYSGTRWPTLLSPHHPGSRAQFRLPKLEALLAALVCAVIGGGLSHIMIASAQTGQIIGSLLVAFTIAALVTQLIFPHLTNPATMLFSPMIVALVGYAYMLTIKSSNDVLEALNHGRLTGLALALPIHYASAAVAGCALGIGWAHGFLTSEQDAEETARAIDETQTT
ncbi:MAG: hypothetical protein WD042_02125 [Phycisphaeraceae bacterium]